MFGNKLNLAKFSRTEQDKTVYAPLRDGASSSSEKDSERDDDELIFARSTKKPHRLFSFFVTLLLVVTNILTIAGLLATKHLTVQLDAVEPEYTPKSAGKLFP